MDLKLLRLSIFPLDAIVYVILVIFLEFIEGIYNLKICYVVNSQKNFIVN